MRVTVFTNHIPDFKVSESVVLLSMTYAIQISSHKSKNHLTYVRMAEIRKELLSYKLSAGCDLVLMRNREFLVMLDSSVVFGGSLNQPTGTLSQ